MLRKIIFWTHFVVAVVVSVVILMLSVTGVLLTYDRQLTDWAHRQYQAPARSSQTTPLSIDELLERVAGDESAIALTAITVRADPREPAALNVGRGDYLYASRYTGALLNDGDSPMRHFLRSTMYWHRWFALQGADRDFGRAITGAANLGFFLLLVSGVYLVWPRTWTLHSVLPIIMFRRDLRKRARDLNWHNVIGFWLFAPLLIIVTSGLVISYGWAGDLVYRVVGETPPVSTSLRDVGTSVQAKHASITPCSFQTLVERVAKTVPDWKSITLTVPESNDAPVVFTVDRSNGGQPSKRLELTFSRLDCVSYVMGGYPTYSRGQKLRSWLRYAHTGEVYGFAGQTIAGVASLGGVVLVWTGLAMAWRRFFRS